jgi:hypothetical protein
MVLFKAESPVRLVASMTAIYLISIRFLSAAEKRNGYRL